MNSPSGPPAPFTGELPSAQSPLSSAQPEEKRPRVRGRLITSGQETLLIRGVTYGTFATGDGKSGYPDPHVVNRDFEAMVRVGVNAVRTYTPPPRWLLDLAQQHGLWVAVGLAWEQRASFLDDPKHARKIEDQVAEQVRPLAGHAALLCFLIGNEIPSTVVRWHGKSAVESFLRRLQRRVKAVDPGALVSYVNFPSTEYLDLSFCDFLAFNVYLEKRAELESYLRRLHAIAGDRPLVLMELGLDSRRNGLPEQARSLEWQLRAAFASGVAGAFVFAWTDEWHRDGYLIDDWDFGLVTRDRCAKPALEAARRAFLARPFACDTDWPSVSVVICSFNGERTLADTLGGLERVRYPNFETIVVDDGSSDRTPAIAHGFGARVISTENRGLSSARNTGADAASGDIVAFLDDDAWPEPYWLQHLANVFMTTSHAAAGGPNLAPPGDGLVADCVANAPGNPTEVMLTDDQAEHVPGCNLAIRRDALAAIGGFDSELRVAGDDVDLCWRLIERGDSIGFSPGAVVWHHRRNSVRRYWKQQVGYGRAEALLERKWPGKFNRAGHHSWAGRIYAAGATPFPKIRRPRVFQGRWGTALFQSVYQPSDGAFWTLPIMPEWPLLAAALTMLGLLGLSWSPLLASLPLAAIVFALTLTHAVAGAAQADLQRTGRSRKQEAFMRLVIAYLHWMQPLARLRGRFGGGLTPWRRQGARAVLPRAWSLGFWVQTFKPGTAHHRELESELIARRAAVTSGGDFDGWDFEVRGGLAGASRLLLTIEEPGGGQQFLRMRAWPHLSWWAAITTAAFFALAGLAALDGSVVATIGLSITGAVLLSRSLYEAGVATAIVADATTSLSRHASETRNATPQPAGAGWAPPTAVPDHAPSDQKPVPEPQ